MINISDVNRQLVEQDEQLRTKTFAAITTRIDDPSLRAIAELVAKGLAAIHERHGNHITLMLQASG